MLDQLSRIFVNPADRDMISRFLLVPTTEQDVVYLKRSDVLRILDDEIKSLKAQYVEYMRDYSTLHSANVAETHNNLLKQRKKIAELK